MSAIKAWHDRHFFRHFFRDRALATFQRKAFQKLSACQQPTLGFLKCMVTRISNLSFFSLFILHFLTVKQWIIDDLIKIKETYFAIAAFCISEVWTVCVDGLNFGVCCTWISSDSRIHQRQATPEDIHWCGRLNQIGPTNQHLMVWTACSFGVC